MASSSSIHGRLWFLALAICAIIGAASSRAAQAGPTELVSVRLPGQSTAALASFIPDVSADGRFAVFSSDASDLVPDDTNELDDIFVRNLATGAVERVSVSSSGEEANAGSFQGAISGDGRYVAFYSDASNLVPGDTNSTADIFVRDRQSGITERMSVSSSGTQANGFSAFASISADGRYVAFSSSANNLVPGDSNGVGDVFVHDRQTSTTTRMSVNSSGVQSNAGAGNASISKNGRYVVFVSSATNLAAGDTNNTNDVFVRDRQANLTQRVSLRNDGGQGNGASVKPRISTDGHYVSFRSAATNLVTGDSNGINDIFVRDRQAGTTERVSVGPGGAQSNGDSDASDVSADGRYVTFNSIASNLVAGDGNDDYDVFLRDRLNGTTTLISVAAGGGFPDSTSGESAISADGLIVVFASLATNLVAGDLNDVGDIFVRDRQASTTGVVSAAVVPSEAAGASNLLSLEAVSADGRFVVFESFTGNLVEDDDNRVEDIFVRDRQLGTVERVSVDSSGNEANGPSNRQFAISADGQHVAYQSDATNLVPIDTNRVGDVFVRDRQTGITERVSVASDGSEGDDQSGFASISGDGRYVAFNSDARNLVSADTNDFTDVFVRDRQTGITERVSVNSSGVQGNSFSSEPSLSSGWALRGVFFFCIELGIR